MVLPTFGAQVQRNPHCVRAKCILELKGFKFATLVFIISFL